MKNKYLLILLFPLFAFPQTPYFDFFKTINPSGIDTGILYDRVFPLADLTSGNSFADAGRMAQALYELSGADYQNRFLNNEEIKLIKKLYQAQKQIPLSIIVTEFQKINPAAFEDKVLSIDSDGRLTEISSLSEEYLNRYEVALGGTLTNKYNGLTVTYILPENLLINTTNNSIAFIQTDLGNGNFIPLNTEEPIHITYSSGGIKDLIFLITMENGEQILVSSEIMVEETESRAVETIESSIAFQGYDETEAYTGIGEYEIYLDTNDEILDKPILFIDGFDPGDTRPISSLYDALTYSGGSENLADEARALGYDIVFLNFPVYQRTNGDIVDGGADYIQRNAFVLIELINLINSEKVGDEPLVIIGPSMGGLISRYALKYMEDNDMNHDTRLWLSFDSPHLGANILIGMQHLMNYIAYGPMGDINIQIAVDGMLRSPAAKQMLIDHLDGHLLPDDPVEFDPTIVLPVGAPNFRNVFQDELEAMGYPELTRNIAIANGTGNGTTTGTPGMNLIEFEFYPDGQGGNTRALIDVYFAPEASQTELVDRIRLQFFLFVWITLETVEAYSMAPAYTSGLDSAPGGQFDIAALAAVAGQIPVIQEFLDNLNIDKFNFIPTLSSLAITSTNNWYNDISIDDITVFDNVYIPEENEIHVTLTEENVQFAKDEIFITAHTEDYTTSYVKLLFNPVKETIELSGQISDARITLSDITGKLLFKQNIEINGRTVIPVQLAQGIYILNVSNGRETTRFKVIKQ